MYDRSPIKHLDAVQTPSLLLLGAKDRRVPMCQGLEYYHALRSKGVPTKCLVFPEDTHALDNPATDLEHWNAIAEWLKLHLNL